MAPDDPRFREALHAGRDNVFLCEFVQHEGARHPADVREREVAEKRCGKDDVGQGVPERVELALKQGVDEDAARDGLEEVGIAHVDAARSFDPAELGIEEEETHEAEPEDRHRIANQAQKADDLVDETSALDRGQYAERHAQNDTDEGSQTREFERCRKGVRDVGHHRPRGQDRGPEIAGDRLLAVDPELLDQGKVETELLAHPRIDVRRRAIAHDRDHGIDRDDAPDKEGDGEEAEQGRHDHDAEASDRQKGRTKGVETPFVVGCDDSRSHGADQFLRTCATLLVSEDGPSTNPSTPLRTADTSTDWNMITYGPVSMTAR